MCANHTCHASSSQWRTSDWAFPPVNRRNCCCAAPPPLLLLYQAPLTPRQDKSWSSPLRSELRAPEECELIQFVQGDVGKDRRGGYSEEICREQSATLQMERVGVLYGKQRGGGGEENHWSLNYMHEFIMPMPTSSALHFVSMSSALQHMYYLYIAYVSLITHECIFSNGAFPDLLQLAG